MNWKPFWEKKKMLVTSIFSFSQNFFYSSNSLNFEKFKILLCGKKVFNILLVLLCCNWIILCKRGLRTIRVVICNKMCNVFFFFFFFFFINPLLHKNKICDNRKGLLEILWEKEKILVARIASFAYNFCPFLDKCHDLIYVQQNPFTRRQIFTIVKMSCAL